jgi:hypothetical protein
MTLFSSTDRQVETAQAEQNVVVVVRAPFETTSPCHAAEMGTLLRPGPVETKEIQPGFYPVTYERCACGELEATVKFDALLVSRTTGPWWRRRTMRTSLQVATTDVVSGPADDIHEGRIIGLDDAGKPAAYFAYVTEDGPTPYTELF